jgi:chromosome segregation ATPase
MHELRKEIERIIKDKIRDKVREEERVKLEKELDAERDKLRKERQSVEQEKIALAGNSNKLDFREKHLAQARAELEHDRAALRKEKAQFESDMKEHQELVKKLPLIRRDYEKLKSKMVAFGDRIRLNTRLEENIARREKALAEAQRHLGEMESKIKQEGFSGYLETEASGQSFISRKLSQGDILKERNPDIYAMVDDCKSAIWRNQLSHAKEVYMKLRDRYHSARMSDAERELLYTTIRELYDDITLAGMGTG